MRPSGASIKLSKCPITDSEDVRDDAASGAALDVGLQEGAFSRATVRPVGIRIVYREVFRQRLVFRQKISAMACAGMNSDSIPCPHPRWPTARGTGVNFKSRVFSSQQPIHRGRSSVRTADLVAESSPFLKIMLTTSAARRAEGTSFSRAQSGLENRALLRKDSSHCGSGIDRQRKRWKGMPARAHRKAPWSEEDASPAVRAFLG